MMRMRESVIVRTAAALLAGTLLASCSGTSPIFPTAGFAPGATGGAATAISRRHKILVRMRIRIPRRTHAHVRTEHPSSISPLTQSVGISINGGTQLLFNTTPSSPGCAIGPTGNVCTFNLSVAPGTATFVATTYSATGGTGTALDHGVAQVPITIGKANSVVISLGPVVSTTADSNVGSLRYAVATANAGDTIMFLIPNSSTIELTRLITISGNVTIAGPGVSSGITISGGGANQIFSVTGTATISGLILTGGKAASPGTPGGAIDNTGTLTLANDSIGNNVSTATIRRAANAGKMERLLDVHLHPHCTLTYAHGGAVYNNGTLVMSGNTLNGNIVPSNLGSCIQGEGGAIFNDTLGTLSSTGDTFSNNSAYNGGAVFNNSIGPVTFSGDTFTANSNCNATSGCPTTCSSPGSMCASFAIGSGGAIVDTGVGVSIDSSTFTNNASGGPTQGSNGTGGALLLLSGLPSVTNSTFTGNMAGGGSASCSQGRGGAIAVGVPLVLNNDTFANNQAVGDTLGEGGAIFAGPSAAIQGTSDTFTSNAAVGSGSACTASAPAGGGAFYSLGNSTLSKSTFTGNSSSSNAQSGGGAIAAVNVTLQNDTFASNTSTATGAFGVSSPVGAGGAVFTSTIAKVFGNTFTSNGAVANGSNNGQAEGGAILAGGSGGLLSMSGNTFTSNAATEGAGGTGAAAGGGVALFSGGAGVSIGDTFKSNTASSPGMAGGGGFGSGGGFVMSNDTFTGNATSGAGQSTGGALYAAGSVTTSKISNTTFTGNTTGSSSGESAGGAIVDTAGLTLQNVVIAQNTAGAAAGGILNQAPETIENTTITGNTVTNGNIANAGGGGIWAAGTLSMAYSTISNNVVNISGTGPAGGGGIFNDGNAGIYTSTISGNSVLGVAPGAGGGGIFDFNALLLNDSTVSNNVSHVDGGGIEQASSTSMTLINATIYQNTASGNGGNINNLDTTVLSNSIVAGGSAPTGPDIHNAGTLTSGDYNIIQTPVAGAAIGGTTGNNQAVDPQLTALANNGGPAFTNADKLHGPGQGVIPFSGGMCNGHAVLTDERGYTRGTGGFCDIGAYEFNAVAGAIRHRPPPLRAMKHRENALHTKPLVLRPLTLLTVRPGF
jgi:hypothetical protein